MEKSSVRLLLFLDLACWQKVQGSLVVSPRLPTKASPRVGAYALAVGGVSSSLATLDPRYQRHCWVIERAKQDRLLPEVDFHPWAVATLLQAVYVLVAPSWRALPPRGVAWKSVEVQSWAAAD